MKWLLGPGLALFALIKESGFNGHPPFFSLSLVLSESQLSLKWLYNHIS